MRYFCHSIFANVQFIIYTGQSRTLRLKVDRGDGGVTLKA